MAHNNPSSTVVIRVDNPTPGGRRGHYVRFADGLMSNIEGTGVDTWLDDFPLVTWNQNGNRFDELFQYSEDKKAAMSKLASSD